MNRTLEQPTIPSEHIPDVNDIRPVVPARVNSGYDHAEAQRRCQAYLDGQVVLRAAQADSTV